MKLINKMSVLQESKIMNDKHIQDYIILRSMPSISIAIKLRFTKDMIRISLTHETLSKQ